MLFNNEFQDIIKFTPLIAIDLLISYKNKILLGRKVNQPTKDRIFKGNPLEKAS